MEGVLGAVQTEDGTEHTKLHPACVQFAVFDALHVAADIVTPPAVPDVGRRGRKVGLEVERLPGDDGIAGEADRIAVIAQPAPTREDKRPLARAPQVVEMQMVEPPQRIQAR